MAAQLRECIDKGYLFLPDHFDSEEVGMLRRAAQAVSALDREDVWCETNVARRTAFAAHT